MRKFAIGIITCDRRVINEDPNAVNYAAETINAARRDPSWQRAAGHTIFVDGPGDHVKEAAADLRWFCKAIVFDGGDTGAVGWRPLRVGCYANMYACVRYHHAMYPDHDLLLLEDDLSFTDEWLTALWRLASYNDHLLPKSFLISGYSPHEILPDDQVAPEYPLARHKNFYATCCVWLSKDAVAALIASLPKPGLEAKPFDLLVRHATKTKAIEAFATLPSVVDHVGFESSVGREGARRAFRVEAVRVDGPFSLEE